jgi:tRNA-guanine family transglycosylase
MVKRNTPGYAIGGLSGGEEKSQFWRVVTLCTDLLPLLKPRYCMGVGYALDLVVCSALGVDMYDCVFPTRTGRFGNALTRYGSLSLKQTKYAKDIRPIDPDCPCIACKNYTRAFLHRIVAKETVASTLISIHNITYQMRLMKGIRQSIEEDRFPDFIRQFCRDLFPNSDIPQWAVEAFRSVNVELDKVE